MLGFHFHPIMGHYAVDEPALNPLFETIAGLRVPVMIDVGTTGMGAGMPGGMGARLEHARPLAIDNLGARFPALTIIGSDYPSLPYERILREWDELGYDRSLMDLVFYANAERVLGL